MPIARQLRARLEGAGSFLALGGCFTSRKSGKAAYPILVPAGSGAPSPGGNTPSVRLYQCHPDFERMKPGSATVIGVDPMPTLSTITAPAASEWDPSPES